MICHHQMAYVLGYDILKMLDKDAYFLYDTIETYIKDAEKANKLDLVDYIYQNRSKKTHAYV
jgi:hypothetical protein